jgi:hypothetical protein
LAISLSSSGTDFGVWIADIKRLGVYETHASKVNKYVRLSGLWKLTSSTKSNVSGRLDGKPLWQPLFKSAARFRVFSPPRC